jgi:hypothetical protein
MLHFVSIKVAFLLLRIKRRENSPFAQLEVGIPGIDTSTLMQITPYHPSLSAGYATSISPYFMATFDNLSRPARIFYNRARETNNLAQRACQRPSFLRRAERCKQIEARVGSLRSLGV